MIGLVQSLALHVVVLDFYRPTCINFYHAAWNADAV